MDTGMKHRRKVTILKLWQVRALRNKRTPLPEHPNETPWEELKDRNLVVVLAELTSLGKLEHLDTPKTPTEVSSYYRRWTQEEINLLVTEARWAVMEEYRGSLPHKDSRRRTTVLLEESSHAP
ncbi:hypothetical protein V2G26_006196 [Clonostachys chloroleuca]